MSAPTLKQTLKPLLVSFTLATAAFASVADAAQVRKFDAAALTAAQAQGLPILVDVKAPWCPVCASQSRTIKAATSAPQYDKLVIFDLDYDTQQAAWKALGVRKQATLISYRGRKEVGRLEFETDKGVINKLLAKTVR